MDVPVDLSKVLFVCTANFLETLHPALLDRMEIINIAGYTHKEKAHILNEYLLPRAIIQAGLKPELHKFKITEDLKETLIKDYCREPGVRSLKKYINTICEKVNICNNSLDCFWYS